MPNHVYNHVNMKGIGNRDFYSIDQEDATEYFDFNKVIPMPQELEMSRSPVQLECVDEVIYRVLDYIATHEYPFNQRRQGGIPDLNTPSLTLKKEHDERIKQMLSHGNTEESIIKEGLQYINNVLKYGYPCWYSWCCANWGTKWNAYWFSLIDDDNIAFTTAWDIPEKIYIAISKMYPYDEITVHWDNEGGFSGITRYLDGEMIEQQVYAEVIPEDADDDYWDKSRLFTEIEILEEYKK